MKSSKPAVILVGHGSKLAGFQDDMEKVAAALRSKKKFGDVSCAYLEINAPSISGAIDQALRGGAKSIFIVPYFLLKGRHTQEDIPKIVREAQTRCKGMARIVLCDYLGFDKRIVQLVEDKVSQESLK